MKPTLSPTFGPGGGGGGGGAAGFVSAMKISAVAGGSPPGRGSGGFGFCGGGGGGRRRGRWFRFRHENFRGSRRLASGRGFGSFRFWRRRRLGRGGDQDN